MTTQEIHARHTFPTPQAKIEAAEWLENDAAFLARFPNRTPAQEAALNHSREWARILRAEAETA